MTEGRDCLVCGHPPGSAGRPECDCLTHSLSHPVPPAEEGPNPADVALFPLDFSREERSGRPRSHRRPKNRGRVVSAAGGALASVVGCAALAASLLSGGGRPDEAAHEESASPNFTMPDRDGEAEPDESQYQPPPEPRPTETPAHSPPPSEEPPDGPDDPAVPTSPPSEPKSTPEPEPSEGEDSKPPPPPTTEPSDPTDPPDPTVPPDEGPLELWEGDQGPEVVELQLRLTQLYWVYWGEAHGSFDAVTRDAVARFQLAYGVQGDPKGVYGPHTRAALELQTQPPDT